MLHSCCQRTIANIYPHDIVLSNSLQHCQMAASALQAAARAPSIVFLDELDGLVPARGASANPGTQIYASVVSTLLALLDGIADRGDVVIIGATNRRDTSALPYSNLRHSCCCHSLFYTADPQQVIFTWQGHLRITIVTADYHLLLG